MMRRAVALVLAAALIFAVASFGGAPAWARTGLLGLFLLTSLLLLAGLLRGDVKPVRSWTYLPIGLFIGIIVVQQLSVSNAVMRSLSPHTWELKQQLLGAAEAPASTSGSISFYSLATSRDLRLVICASAVFLLVLHICRSREHIQQLLVVVSGVGLGCALFAIGQSLSNAESIYGIVPIGHKASGPFMNHSHFGQFMNLSIGAALGLMLSYIPGFRKGETLSLGSLREAIVYAPRGVMILCAATVVLGAVAVFLSLTRVGIISLISATALTTMLVLWRHGARGRVSILLAVALVCLIGLLIAGVDPIFHRLGTLRNIDAEDGGRWQTIKDLTTTWAQFPLLGTGLGTFQYIYPMYDTTNVPRLATHAENEYAQLLTETGFIGFAIFLAFGGMILWKFVAAVREQSNQIQAAVFGVGLGLLAVVIHSCTDFGQHAPAVAILTAALLAVVVNLAELQPPKRPASSASPAVRSARLIPITCVLMLAGGLAWAGWGEVRSARAEVPWNQTKPIAAGLQKVDWQADDATYLALLQLASKAAEIEPDDVEYSYWLNVYRWRSISRMKDRTTGQVILSEAGLGHTKRLVDEFLKMARVCPTYGPSYWMAGRLRYNVLGETGGDKLIDLAYGLTRHNSYITLDAASLDFDLGHVDAALQKLRHFIELRPAQVSTATTLCLDRTTDVNLSYSLAQGNAEALLDLGNKLRERKLDPAMAERCHNDARQLLEAEVAHDAAPVNALIQLADLNSQRGEDASAIALYRRALQQDFAQLDWRMRLAKALVRQGRRSEAQEEVKICLRLSPQRSDAVQLLATLAASN